MFFQKIRDAFTQVSNNLNVIESQDRDTLFVISSDASIIIDVSNIGGQKVLDLKAVSGPALFGFAKVSDGVNFAQADQLQDTLLLKSTSGLVGIVASDIDDSINFTVNQGNLNLNSIGGVLDVVKGGTGATSFVANALLIGNTTSAISSLNLGTANQILSMNTTGTAHEYRTLDSGNNTIIFTFAANSIDAKARLATELLPGISRLSVAPVLASDPIAVGDNDSRLVIPSGIIIKRKPVDQSVINSTVLQDDNDLFFSIDVNEKWQVEGYLDATSASNAPDLKIAWDAPVGASINIAYHVNNGASPSTINVDIMTTVGGTSVIPLTANNPHPIFFKGVVVNGGTAGTFKLQWAQNTSNVNATTLKANSYLKATKING